MKSNSGSKHIRIIRFIDDVLIKGVFVDEGRGNLIETVTTATLPILCFGDAAGVLSGDDLVQTHLAVRVGVVTHFYTNPAPSHFLRNSGSGAGAKERVEHKVAGVGGNVDNAFNEALRFWRFKNILSAE